MPISIEKQDRHLRGRQVGGDYRPPSDFAAYYLLIDDHEIEIDKPSEDGLSAVYAARREIAEKIRKSPPMAQKVWAITFEILGSNPVELFLYSKGVPISLRRIGSPGFWSGSTFKRTPWIPNTG